MATIKPIEASSVHQIQSGQVIVDLCSVAKELVENGLDAGATSIEVRFKNQGLDSIEVQDNGSGISPANYESLALKHYTSKLFTYSDLTTLETFGFRGEALSSLCALSRFTVTTCLQADVPKGTKLDFDLSGQLKGTSVVATQKGTTVTVENLFQSLPVRRRELERNIKREWGKVITLLNQYACVQTGVKFTVIQQPNKGKRIVLFSTKGNKTTRENIINVFGAKTMAALVPLDLKLQLEPTGGPIQKWNAQGSDRTQNVLVLGFVSRPVHGEGRQTPDRQLFYVNSRPCGLPQFAKVFNEVYRAFNSSQSPFIFADIQLDTHLYDVNVSPDKRTILLHDQSRMLENLRDALTELFEKQEYTVPMSQITPLKQTPFTKPTFSRQQNIDEEASPDSVTSDPPKFPCEGEQPSQDPTLNNESSGVERFRNLAAAKALAREAQMSSPTTQRAENMREISGEAETIAEGISFSSNGSYSSGRPEMRAASKAQEDIVSERNEREVIEASVDSAINDGAGSQEKDFLARLAKMKRSFLPTSLQDETMNDGDTFEAPIPALSKPNKLPENAPLSAPINRPPKRPSQEVATITIGDQTVTSIIGTPPKRSRRDEATEHHTGSQKQTKKRKAAAALPSFGGRLTQMFAAAAARQQSSIDEDEVTNEDAHNDQGSQDEGDVSSGSDPESAEDANTGSQGDDDYINDAKSSPLFVDDDDIEQSPVDDRRSQDPDEMDEEYVDDADDETAEEVPGDNTVETAEEENNEPSEDNKKRTQTFLKGGAKGKYITQSLLQRARVDEDVLGRRLRQWARQMDLLTNVSKGRADGADQQPDGGVEAANAEEKLSLAIHKGDFGTMKIVGQFNLGFILAVRPSTTTSSSTLSYSSVTSTAATQLANDDELFIIDQHASDEKFNFERLQSMTVVQSQRLVRPKPLELTAVEEEIVIENRAALEKNGFIVSIDESGDEPVGSRCQLLALPLSRETTFSLADLEELISLLGDNPTTTVNSAFDHNDDNDDDDESIIKLNRHVPRPSKVRKMFAMRACRCSIMIGKALTHRQMETVVRHMGGMEKPWNCPHGRPTMRHLCGLGSTWDQRGWREGDGYEDEQAAAGGNRRTTDWAAYVKQKRSES